MPWKDETSEFALPIRSLTSSIARPQFKAEENRVYEDYTLPQATLSDICYVRVILPEFPFGLLSHPDVATNNPLCESSRKRLEPE